LRGCYFGLRFLRNRYSFPFFLSRALGHYVYALAQPDLWKLRLSAVNADCCRQRRSANALRAPNDNEGALGWQGPNGSLCFPVAYLDNIAE
jgi:hypothetical protein